MYNFILNPVAGRGKALKAIKKIEKYLSEKNIPYKIYKTDKPLHATAIAAEISQNCNNVIAAGGDGTVNEVLNGMQNFENCSMGIIPCGTGNDFAKFVGIEKNPLKAMEKIINNTPVYTDYLKLNGKRVINVTGMGMDVAVLERCRKNKFFKGKLQYLVSLIRVLLHFDWYKFDIEIDGNSVQNKTALLVAACNGKYFGGGLPISPLSDISDNYLNLIIINKLKKSRIPLALINLLRGKLLKYDFVENILCKKVKITSAGGNTVNIDGEIVKDIPFECELVKNCLKVFR